MPTTDYLNPLSTGYVEQIYAEYLQDPSRVEPAWREYFRRVADGNGGPHPQLTPSFRPTSIFNPATPPRGPQGVDGRALAQFQQRIDQLVWHFRLQGHLVAQIDPLGLHRPNVPELTPQAFGFTRADLDQPIPVNPLPHLKIRTLSDLFENLRRIYGSQIGVEFMHIGDPAIRTWVQRRMEAYDGRPILTREARIRFLSRLTDAVTFDQFVLRKYVGAKVFSIEGAEVLIPLLEMAIDRASEEGVQQIVMGMAHRGRLNVLANVLGKSPRRIFCEFEDASPVLSRGGDVKYHLGHSNDWMAPDGRKVRLTLCFNPSHLEFVNPVAQGSLRAKEDRAGDIYHEQGMALLIHGDAALAGEGIIQETLNLSQLAPYQIGGTLHVVINNQIGFTTPPKWSRAGAYATDVAKMLEVPIFHVNGEEPEAVARALLMAMEFRRTFARDAFVDVYCYRRHGHNEGDEPEFTQPAMYSIIHQRRGIRDLYADRLVAEGTLTRDDADHMAAECVARLEDEYTQTRSGDMASAPSRELSDVWQGYRAGRETIDEKISTAVDRSTLADVLERLTQTPDGFHLHPKLQRWMDRRRAMARGEQPLDWSAAEALALATLAMDGYRVRLTGQDSTRGTFSHRHALLHDVQTGQTFMPLARVAPDQAPVEIFNSPLSEAGVLGFEYGFSLDYPDCLVAWEAQFGDFWNVAQVIVDQFIASAEEKWHHLSGIVLLLPHGFEGQGPEHSSARLERFLNLATEHNIQIVVPTTPAQFFHCLRRQMLRRWLKPLVVMSPKSLLRHPRVLSSLDELASGHFHRIIPDPDVPADQVRRVLVCTGKVYYDLLQAREDRTRPDVAIVRMEQLYPVPEEPLRAVLERYPAGTPVAWVQEEPGNMGALQYLQHRLGRELFGKYPLTTVSRDPSASPATGSMRIHRQEQQCLLAEAFGET